MKRKLLVFSIVALLLLGACSANKPSNTPMDVYAPGTGYFSESDVEAPMDFSRNEDNPESPAPDPDSPTTQERLVIKTADMRVSVADPESAMHSVAQLANRLGGFVVSSQASSATSSSGGYKSASISIRIPTEKLEEAMQAIRELAASGKDGVLSEYVSGQDVTSDYVDSQSRLRNLEAAEEQLMALMENTTDLEQTMAVFRELTRTREQIEVLQGHIKYLKESASMSMISTQFVAEASLKPIQIAGWKPQGTAREALQTLINIGQGIVDFLIRFGIVCLPFLIPLGIGIFFLVKALKKRKAKKQAALANYYAQVPKPQGEQPKQ
jgi:putative lipoic acid-binding regulatory protein